MYRYFFMWMWTQKTFIDWSESYFLEWNRVKWVKSHTDSTGKQRNKLDFIRKYSFQWHGYHSTALVAKHCWKCLFLRITSFNKIFVSLSFPCHQPCSFSTMRYFQCVQDLHVPARSYLSLSAFETAIYLLLTLIIYQICKLDFYKYFLRKVSKTGSSVYIIMLTFPPFFSLSFFPNTGTQ